MLTYRKPPQQRNLVNQQVTFMVKLKILFDFIFCPIRQLYPVLLLDEEHSYLEGKTCHLSHPSSVGSVYLQRTLRSLHC